MQTFIDRLIELMRLKGKTAYDIMRNTGMSQSTVGNYLKNEKLTPTLKILKKLSEYFAVDEHWLLTGEGSPFPTKSDSIVEEPQTVYGAILSAEEIISKLVQQNEKLISIIDRHVETILNLSKK